MPKSQKGRKQYNNPVRAAIARSTGLATAGTRASSSKNIRENSELRRNARTTTYRVQSKNEFLDKMGVPKNKRGKTSIVRERNATRIRHKADVKDPTTGFGINVNQVRRYHVTTGS